MIICKQCGGEVVVTERHWWETGDEVLDCEKAEYLAKCQSCGWKAREYTVQTWDTTEEIFDPKPPEFYFDEEAMFWFIVPDDETEAESNG